MKTTLVSELFELGPGTSAAFDFPSGPDSAGDVVATVDWTHASNAVVAAFGSRSCPGVNHALAGSCNQGLLFARASTCPAKPRVLSAQVVGSAPVRLFVANAASSPESGAACGQCELERSEFDSCP